MSWEAVRVQDTCNELEPEVVLLKVEFLTVNSWKGPDKKDYIVWTINYIFYSLTVNIFCTKKNCITNVPKKQQQMLKASWPSILCRINQVFGWKLDWHHAKSKTEAKKIVSRQALPFYVIFNQISKNMQNFFGVLLNVRLKLNLWTWPRQVSGYIYQWVFQSNNFLTFLSAYFKPVGNSVVHI